VAFKRGLRQERKIPLAKVVEESLGSSPHQNLYTSKTRTRAGYQHIYITLSQYSSMSTPPSRMSFPKQPEAYLSIGQRAHHGDEGWKSSASSVFDLNVTSPVFNTHTPNRPRSRASPLLRDRRRLPSDDQQNDPISFIVISGGTGCNAICSAFEGDTAYVLPVSDDGGSSSEIIRVLGI
jgi:hypothetical protein